MRNKIILLAICFFLGASPCTLAQDVVVYSDTTLRVKHVKEDKNLILPKLKSPQQLCIKLQTEWCNYLKKHPDIIKEFSLDKDSIEYSPAMSIHILKNGTVAAITKKPLAPNIGHVCYEALKPILQKSVWSAAYKKLLKKRKYIDTNVEVYFVITKNGLKRVGFIDIKTMERFHECLQPSLCN